MVDYSEYLKRLKNIVEQSIQQYFDDDEDTNLSDVLTNAGLYKYYVKFNGWLKAKEIKSPLSYESFEQLAVIDYKGRSPLEIRCYLMGIPTPDYSNMSKKELIDLLISKNSYSS